MSPEALAAHRREAVRKLMAEREAAAQQRLERALGHSGIPARFRDKSFEHFEAATPAQQHVLRTCRAFSARMADSAGQGDSLLLIGGPGTGKTHLASAILAKAMRAGRTGCFFSVAAALRLVRETYSPNAPRSESAALALLTEPDVLVLDEVGVAIGHEDKRQAMLFEILDMRYTAVRSTILIGNLTIAEMRSYLGERMMDRLSDGQSAILAFDWPSYRSTHRSAAAGADQAL
jgi:DNA replication protein DnaC